MSESEWFHCQSPHEMLHHLNGKIDDEAFMPFSVACCYRIWPLITDARSRAVVEATKAYLADRMTVEQARPICAEWVRAYEANEVKDRAGGSTNEAIEAVYGLGQGHAVQVSMACSESVGYAAAESLRAAGVPDSEIKTAWLAAEAAEQEAQCNILRELFPYQSK